MLPCLSPILRYASMARAISRATAPLPPSTRSPASTLSSPHPPSSLSFTTKPNNFNLPSFAKTRLLIKSLKSFLKITIGARFGPHRASGGGEEE